MKRCKPSKPLPVLYLDDESDEHLLLHHAAWSIRAPIRIWSVTTIEAAVEALSVTPAQRRPWQPIPALILLDYHLRSTTSQDLLCWIESRMHLKRIPVVVYSGSEDQEEFARAYAAGADAFLSKPIGLGRLQEVVGALARCVQWNSLEPLTMLEEYRPEPATRSSIPLRVIELSEPSAV
jgi:CheY-like chemotaxis protein